MQDDVVDIAYSESTFRITIPLGGLSTAVSHPPVTAEVVEKMQRVTVRIEAFPSEVGDGAELGGRYDKSAVGSVRTVLQTVVGRGVGVGISRKMVVIEIIDHNQDYEKGVNYTHEVPHAARRLRPPTHERGQGIGGHQASWTGLARGHFDVQLSCFGKNVGGKVGAFETEDEVGVVEGGWGEFYYGRRIVFRPAVGVEVSGQRPAVVFWGTIRA
ncbi:uncharacterized protein KY384_003517 [Bacidia gigantensis]|uniref:uncharacterized protein n=1 Tax=Bacidia gigantensis TaxID=2732470 RepID=UPI001D050C0C|nr:uncharacterized protein KY384_003517 [Bacidia gigantensis]KAG8531881.1 hypothetical protein KY384_003517 [Bacidia gigantensis]